MYCLDTFYVAIDINISNTVYSKVKLDNICLTSHVKYGLCDQKHRYYHTLGH